MNSEVELINRNGLQTQKEEEAFAKKSGSKYFIRKDSAGFLYNPDGIYNQENNKTFSTKMGKDVYQFRSVTENSYRMYIRFLLTKNTLYLRKAEREIQ